jgi:Thiamine pyrophosphate enzyme, N-terminal TPP binding domain
MGVINTRAESSTASALRVFRRDSSVFPWYMEPFRMHREPGKPARGVSRRSFIRQAAASASAVAAGSAASEADQSPRQNTSSRDTGRTSSTTPPPSSTPPTIRVPEELIAGSKAPVSEIQFPMTGAQVFARACKDEGVAALFCCPGNYGVIHAIANIGIPAFSGRHEGAMTHAADAFIRVSGELAVVSGTEGPGFTDMICGIACANAARTPLQVVASNMALFQEDTEAGAARFTPAGDARQDRARVHVVLPLTQSKSAVEARNATARASP